MRTMIGRTAKGRAGMLYPRTARLLRSVMAGSLEQDRLRTVLAVLAIALGVALGFAVVVPPTNVNCSHVAGVAADRPLSTLSELLVMTTVCAAGSAPP